MLYKRLLRPLLFLLEAEMAHKVTFALLKAIFKIPGACFFAAKICEVESSSLERNVCGLKFNNPVGLAAGMDKDAKMVDEFAALGFGFVETGTVTPLPQGGNPKPRLFRLKRDEALVNRMGFNNEGAAAAAMRLRKRKSNIIVGGNIGKNKITPNEEAVNDYMKCFIELFDVVDYFVVNVSSPNTPGLRELQEKKPLTEILKSIQKINLANQKPKPVFLKIAPDLSYFQIDEILEIIRATKINGIVACNTTISRSNLRTPESALHVIGAGGLSGKPLKEKSTEIIRYIAKKSNKEFAIIASGGIHSPEDAIEKLDAGADLVQLYTGLIYKGPGLVKRINEAIKSNYQNNT